MVEPLNLRNLAWAITTILEIVLFVFLVKRKQFRTHPALSAYILLVIIQNITGMFVYGFWGFQSQVSWGYAWGSQALVICARAGAVVELARQILAAYKGIWALAWRLFLAVGTAVLGYSLLFSKGAWRQVVMNGNRGVELSIAAVVVTLLLFARYYHLPIGSLDRALAVGFCLYSCFYVINFSLFEPWLELYANFWNFLDILAFLASVSLWIFAVGAYETEVRIGVLPAVSKELYGKLSAELNLRLYSLNEQLTHLLNSRGTRS